MRRFVFFLVLLLSSICSTAAATEKGLEVNVDFPYGTEGFLNVRMYKKGIIGSISTFDRAAFPQRAKITVANKSADPQENIALNFELDSPLTFEKSANSAEGEWKSDSQFLWKVATLAPGEKKSVILYVMPPRQEKVPGEKMICRLRYSGSAEGEFPMEVRNVHTTWLPYFVLFGSTIGLALLFLFGGYRRLFSSYTTAEIVTLAILISFYVACSIFSQILRTFGVPSLIIHTAWAVYFWIFLVSTVRLIPKKGAVILFTFGTTLISGLLLWGLNPVFIMTYTFCAALGLEIWFRLTGYGKTFFSAVGSGFVYFVYPICYFWFCVNPVLFHYFYDWWYIKMWLVISFATYIPAAWLGYLFSNRLMKAVR